MKRTASIAKFVIVRRGTGSCPDTMAGVGILAA
jgi:hypothetical protein